MERVIYDRIRELETGHWWFVARRKVLNRLIRRLAPPAGATILEVGCGAGGNIPVLQPYGSVTALEPDADSRAYVAERFVHEPPPDGLFSEALAGPASAGALPFGVSIALIARKPAR